VRALGDNRSEIVVSLGDITAGAAAHGSTGSAAGVPRYRRGRPKGADSGDGRSHGRNARHPVAARATITKIDRCDHTCTRARPSWRARCRARPLWPERPDRDGRAMRDQATNPLELRQVSRHYDMGGNRVVALDRADLTVRQHEVVMLVGPSGSGKTTLLSIAGGLLSPSSGQVMVAGVDISKASAKKLTTFRRERIGFIFQSVNLVPFLTARENLLVVSEFAKRDMGQARTRADRLLTELGLGHRMTNLPSQLSGGERQRVAIGRALMNQPALVLVDEPTSALDSKLGLQVMELIVSEVKSRGAAAVIVTHDPRMTRFGDRTIAVADGRLVVEAGPRGERLALPSAPVSGRSARVEAPPAPAPAWVAAGSAVGADPRTDPRSRDRFSEPAVARSGEWPANNESVVVSGVADRYEQPMVSAGSPSWNWYENPAAAAAAAAAAASAATAASQGVSYSSPFEELVPGRAEARPEPAPAARPEPTVAPRAIDRYGPSDHQRPAGPPPGQSRGWRGPDPRNPGHDGGSYRAPPPPPVPHQASRPPAPDPRGQAGAPPPGAPRFGWDGLPAGWPGAPVGREHLPPPPPPQQPSPSWPGNRPPAMNEPPTGAVRRIAGGRPDPRAGRPAPPYGDPRGPATGTHRAVGPDGRPRGPRPDPGMPPGAPRRPPPPAQDPYRTGANAPVPDPRGRPQDPYRTGGQAPVDDRGAYGGRGRPGPPPGPPRPDPYRTGGQAPVDDRGAYGGRGRPGPPPGPPRPDPYRTGGQAPVDDRGAYGGRGRPGPPPQDPYRTGRPVPPPGQDPYRTGTHAPVPRDRGRPGPPPAPPRQDQPRRDQPRQDPYRQGPARPDGYGEAAYREAPYRQDPYGRGPNPGPAPGDPRRNGRPAPPPPPPASRLNPFALTPAGRNGSPPPNGRPVNGSAPPNGRPVNGRPPNGRPVNGRPANGSRPPEPPPWPDDDHYSTAPPPSPYGAPPPGRSPRGGPPRRPA
jgi:putative ABC transport system ATP-binding protein